MLFNPTPMEKLTTLANDLIQKYEAAQAELEAMRIEIVSLRAHEKSKDEEIERLTFDLAAKDEEIEAVIAKIESLLD